MNAAEAAKNALKYVLGAVPNERIAVIVDEESLQVGEAFAEGALDLGLWVRVLTLQSGKEIRKEIPQEISDIVATASSDLYVTIFRESEKETPFRVKIIDLIHRYRRYRLGHCPGITLDMLTKGALALSAEEYSEIQSSAQSLMARLAEARSIRVTSPNGTDLSFSVAGREFFTDTKFDWKTYKWGNLPTGEVIVGPVETSLNGVLVCDLAIGGIGPISSLVKITAKDGKSINFECSDKSLLKRIESALSVDEMARYVGEFAFGLNKKARLSANFLEAEKVGNTIHVAFGHNTDFPGGMNNSATHMDFLISKPTVEVTGAKGNRFVVMRDGVLL
ncbi:MAG: aminopeptidase [Candidatus Methanomethyliaceae archaeon]|nr:aminopeptidase [Candidatus Methanomethyliaceae archaeon]